MPNRIELPLDRPALFAANHSSLYDLLSTLLAYGNFNITARIGVNARFFVNPVAGRYLRSLGCIPFSRDRREEAEREMVDALNDGQICAMMPEGRIVRSHELVDGVGPARLGISRIATAADAAIVPIGFAGASEAWTPGKPVPKMGFRRPPVTARFGPPFLLDGHDHEANVVEIMAAISNLIMPVDV